MVSEAQQPAPEGPFHEVFLELTSGTRVVVGRNLPDAATASDVANKWIRIARDHPEDLHLTMPGSGTLVRGAAIIAIQARLQPTKGLLKAPREGVWL